MRDTLSNLKRIQDEGKFFIAVDQGIRIAPDSNDPVSGFTFTILGVVTEFERELIRERIAEGLVACFKICVQDSKLSAAATKEVNSLFQVLIK